MLARLTSFLIIFGIMLLMDFYIYKAVKTLTFHQTEQKQNTVKVIYWGFHALIYLLMALNAIFVFYHSSIIVRNYVFGVIFVLYASKLLLVLFLFIEDLVRGVNWIIEQFSSQKPSVSENTELSTRRKFIHTVGVIAAALPFSALIYGMIKGAYDFRVRRRSINIADLPESFEGFKILQISDIHTGSFVSTNPIKEAVSLINRQDADLVLFTGDLVNDRAEEAVHFVPELKKIRSKNGVYSTLGNHDYGDYYSWESKEAKAKNFEQMLQVHKDMGWDLLNNENRIIKKGNSSIALIGVENWGKHASFQKKGDLEKAYKGTEGQPVKVLMTHDPTHWEMVLDKYKDIDLTLSGHTHGMQFGVDIPGFRWSPSKLIFRHWADLYRKGKQHLYVNRGLGFIGYAGRVGILPEITVFELKKG